MDFYPQPFQISLGLVPSGANFYILTLKTLRIPDLERNRKMMSLSCYIHMLCAKNGYAFYYVSDDAWEVR